MRPLRTQQHRKHQAPPSKVRLYLLQMINKFGITWILPRMKLSLYYNDDSSAAKNNPDCQDLQIN